MNNDNMTKYSAYERAVSSVTDALDHFIETGFWDTSKCGPYKAGYISEAQTRRACRQLAKAMKRPFIRADTGLQYIEIPKRKFLLPLATPLLLAFGEEPTFWKPGDPARVITTETLWAWRISDKAFWDEYYNFILNDPDCRRARKLTS